MSDQLLTAKETAAYLNMHVNTVKKLVKRGSLPAYRIGDRGDLRISQDDIDRWLEARRSE